jgi:hypothetical protein
MGLIFLLAGMGQTFGQLDLKLQLINDSTWGVYVKPKAGTNPTSNTITGSGQVTIVAPSSIDSLRLTSVNGTWQQNARVLNPIEKPGRNYLSVGFVSDNPKIVYSEGQETLLFTFKKIGDCPDTLYLIDNGNDPFDVLPNSANSNPGNDLSVVDFGNNQYYNYSDNYAYSAWSCHDCDTDGILNAFEDTNGNGVFDAGDASHLCDPCDPLGPSLATLSLVSDSIICAGDAGDISNLKVVINGGRSPYRIVYTDGSGNDTISNYLSGTLIPVQPTSSVTYSLVEVRDSFQCVTDTLIGSVPITVQGPLSITTHPQSQTLCSDSSATFTSVSVNGGAGTTFYQWQISHNGGTSYVDLPNGTPYSNATTATLNISKITGLHNKRYRVKIWTTSCDTVFSNPALLQVEGPLAISAHPSNSTICSGTTTTFTGGATNAGVGTLSTVWQVSEDNGGSWTDLSDTAPYSGTSTTTLTITNASVSIDNRLYRMKAFTNTCGIIYTNSALLDVQGPLTFTAHPLDTAICTNEAIYFTYQYTNPGAGAVTFQWQQSTDNGGSWSDLNNTGIFNNTNGTSNGLTGDTLAITDVSGLNGTQYRVRIRTSECIIVESNAATLTVNSVPTFSSHPQDITLCAGSTHKFGVSASIAVGQGTITYNWQISTDNGASWANINPPIDVYSTNAAGDTLSISNVVGLNGYRYRVQLLTSQCDPVTSNEARLSVEGPLAVSAHPENDTVCSGSPASFSATFTNPGLTGSTNYKWQRSTDGVNWSDISNGTQFNGTATQNLSILNSAGRYNERYRLKAWTSKCDTLFTNGATLIVEGPVTVTDQPDAVTTCSGKPASFTVTVNNGGSGILAYQWRISTDNGATWNDLTNGGVYSGVNTTTLNISDVAGLYDRCYKLDITTGQCTVVSSLRACLTVEGPLAITDQPDNVTACSASPVLFAVGTSDGSSSGVIKYFQWQESVNGTGPWTDLVDGTVYNGVQTDTLSISNIAGKDNNRYRVMYWTGTCDTLTSSEAILSVEGPLTVTDEPDNLTQCSGSGAMFQATINNAGLGTLSYQWERSCWNGSSWSAWSDISAGGANGFAGVTGTSLSMTDVAGLDSCRFRMRYWTGTCTAQFTNFATLIVEGPISITDQPDPVTICSGSVASFEVATQNTGSGQITYQWQTKPNGGNSWSNISNNSVYNGVTSSNLSVAVAGLNGSRFRVIIQTSTCSSIISDSATLSVEGPLSFTQHPADVTACSAGSVQFSGAAQIASGNVGSISYQWQVSSDNGVNWNDLSNDAVYSGVTNDTMTVLNIAGLNNRRYRLAANTATCSPVYSNMARLVVEGPIAIASQPANFTSCSDKEAFFHSSITNSGQGVVYYQWQESINGTDWTNLANAAPYNGVKTDTLGISPLTGLDNRYYRMKAWTSTCDTLTTNAAQLGVEGPLIVNNQPNDVTLCSASPTTFSFTVENQGLGTMSYRWQRSTNGGQSWSDLSDGGVYSGVTDTTLVISNIAGLSNNKFRARISTPNCAFVYTLPATLIVEGPITISLQPNNASICSNVGHTFNTTITNPGAGALTFQWQLSTNGGGDWSNLSNTGVYLGARTEDLNISLTAGLNGYMYRLIARTSTCADTTNEVTLTVRDACSDGTCDFDLDGTVNASDADQDNDQLGDSDEAWMTSNNVSAGWNYLDFKGVLLNYNTCSTDSDSNGIIDGLEDPDGDLISNNEETDGDGILDGDPLNPCDPVLGPTCVGINLAIKVQLQGALIGSTDTLMRDDLRTRRYIPEEEPYTGKTGFDHKGGGGGEEILDTATVFNITGADAIVDWVFVELRSPNSPDSVAYTRSGLLQRDGNVVDTNGVSNISIPGAQAGPYFVSVRHRNHLGVMTAEALDLSPILTEVDFTDTSLLNNGSNAQVRVGNKMAMWAGDLDGNKRSVYQGPNNDITKLFLTVTSDQGNTGRIANYISTGYLDADIDLSGRAIYQGPLNDRAIHLFNVILNHPANKGTQGELPLANFIIWQQLP